jgi:hypothetical protein
MGDRGYALISDRREMVTVAMHDGFAKAQWRKHKASALQRARKLEHSRELKTGLSLESAAGKVRNDAVDYA